MRGQSLGLIARKELLDALRDRRTLFVALVLPLLLYPALLLGLTQVIGATQRNLQREQQRIFVDGLPLGGEVAQLLSEHDLVPVAPEGATRRRLYGLVDTYDAEESDGARALLRRTLDDHGIDGAVLFRPGFAGDVSSWRQGEVRLLFDPTDDVSRTARDKVREALDVYARQQRDALLEAFPEDETRLRFAAEPVRRDVTELASREQKGAYSFAPLLGMLIVIMALTGAFYPAVDLVAGEKERGTLETLLVAPVSRTEIVLGKFLAIWVIAVATALLNLAVMGLTFTKLGGMMGGAIAFSLPLEAALAVTVILIPTAALFSAVALALSSFATSYKEGQHYMSPLFLVATPLAMVAMLPNVELSWGLALVPVANVVLMVKAMLLGGEAFGLAALATGAMAVYAAGALLVSVSLFRRESVLFRTGAGTGFDAASLRARRLGLPNETMGILLFGVVVALMFFLSERVESGADVVRAFLLTQIAAILAPTLFFIVRGKLDVPRTLSLRRPRTAHVPLAVVMGAATVLLVLWAYATFMPAREAGEFERMVAELEREVPAWLFCLMLAALPPICEELLCRGFLLSSFRARLGTVGAIGASAVLFGVLHLDLYRFPATCAAGLVMGYVLVRTGSIVASILFHAAYNGTIALAVVWPGWGRALERLGAGTAAVAALVLAAGIVVMERTRADNVDTD